MTIQYAFGRRASRRPCRAAAGKAIIRLPCRPRAGIAARPPLRLIPDGCGREYSRLNAGIQARVPTRDEREQQCGGAVGSAEPADIAQLIDVAENDYDASLVRGAIVALRRIDRLARRTQTIVLSRHPGLQTTIEYLLPRDSLPPLVQQSLWNSVRPVAAML